MLRYLALIASAIFVLNKLSAQDEEILLTFKYPAIGRVYVSCLYDEPASQAFLPITEIFSLLEINYKIDPGLKTVAGTYLTSGKPYVIDFQNARISVGEKVFGLDQDDFRIGAMDYYLGLEILNQAFGLNFNVDISYLMISLETEFKLPVQERVARETERSRIVPKENIANFPMKFPLKRSLLKGAVLDYSLSANFTKPAQNLNYSFMGGMELLGGDLQGALIGNLGSSGINEYMISGLKWRYAILNKRFISTVTAGQISTSGLMPLGIKGIWISNDPIEPRQIYESYVIDGVTEAESEVEVYLNGQLTDYMRADEMGYYRFNLPVMYGTTEINLRIFTPSGDIRLIDRKMQIPFTFLPPGKLSYNFQSGIAEPLAGESSQKSYASHLKLSYGATRWLTVSAGSQKIGQDLVSGDINYYGSLSLRARQYLMNADFAPGAFYRFTGSVVYSNNLNLNCMYTRYTGNNMLFQSSSTEDLQVDLYVPFEIFGLNSGFRFDGGYSMIKNGRLTRYSADYNIGLKRFNLRLNYRDNLLRTSEFVYFGEGIFTTALTYTIARSPVIPTYIKGMYIRGQIQYDIRNGNMKSGELRLSQTFFKKGRLNIITNYNFMLQAFNVELGFTLELNPVRSVTSVNINKSDVYVKEGLFGSIGLDAGNKHIECSRRQQVGKASVAVILFVDNNNSGKYEKGDELLPYKGIYLDKTANMKVGKDSILRITQLQGYYLYNLSVNRNAIADPTLVPMIRNFSFIADPDQYKRIEIPFYRGGTIEGTAFIEKDGNLSGLGGLRLFLTGIDHPHNETIRTFNDGSFYAMDLEPGKYSLLADPDQQGFLNATQADCMEFEIRALSEGDFIDRLKIVLISN
jgi:hypothetical protein